MRRGSCHWVVQNGADGRYSTYGWARRDDAAGPTRGLQRIAKVKVIYIALE